MTDIVIAKIQNRRGLRRDLPQPLSPGEFGYCTDTSQLFLGAESFEDNPQAPNSMTINLYVKVATTENAAIDIITRYLFQVTTVDGPYSNLTPEELNDAEAAFEATLSVYESDVVATSRFQPDPLVEDWYFRGYVGFYEPMNVAPSGTLSVTSASGLTFALGQFDLSASVSTPAYATDDSYAIATLINNIYTNYDNAPTIDSGLVVVDQNIEVVTEFSDIEELSQPRVVDQFSNPVDGQATSIADLTYGYAEADSFVIEYSLYDTAGTAYSRAGSLTITTLNSTASLKDSYVEDSTPGVGIVVDFAAAVTDGDVVVSYVATGASAYTLTLVSNTRKWKSF